MDLRQDDEKILLSQEEKKKLLLNTWMRFNSNVGALYSFFEKTTELADKLDWEGIRKISSQVAALLKQDPEEVEKDISSLFPSMDDLEIYPDIRNDDSVKEMMEAFQDSKFMEQVSEWEQRHPFKSQKFVEIIYSAFVDPPMRGIMLRKSMLITLMTFIEMLIGEMFVNHYLIQGETKKCAIQLASNMTDDGWGKRFSNLEKIGLGSQFQSKNKNKIIEMAKLRNLLVHNDGVIDEDYLKKAPQKHKPLKPGSILLVSTNYFQRAIDTVYSLGFFLCTASWKLNDVPAKEQGKKIDELIIPALNQRRYSLVLEITKDLNGEELPQSTPERLLVDRAIAFRELGETRKVNKIVSNLEELDYSWSISVAIAMLTNNISELQKHLMDKQVPPNISYWPLFGPVKNEIWFKKVFMMKNKQNFPKPSKRR